MSTGIYRMNEQAKKLVYRKRNLPKTLLEQSKQPQMHHSRQFFRSLRNDFEHLLGQKPGIVVRTTCNLQKPDEKHTTASSLSNLVPWGTRIRQTRRTNLAIPLCRSLILFSNDLNSSVAPDLSFEGITSSAHYIENESPPQVWE